MRRLGRLSGSILLVLALAVGSGCSSLGKAPVETNDAESDFLAADNDPYEGFNRAMFRFNDAIDDAVLAPMARGYVKVLPQFVRNRFRGFFLNLLEPTTIVNDVLQAKMAQGAFDAWRFAINSTFGLLGMFDVAAEVGLPRNEEDFGQTFAVWGIGEGPYLVLPLLGPSNARDAIGLVPQAFLLDPRIQLDDSEIYWGLLLWDLLDTRSTLLGASRVLDLQLDPYTFVRESYRQRRINLIHDGNPPFESFDEPP